MSTSSFRAGEIAALIGPNGAGKTTLFNLVSGFMSPSAGALRWKGRDITKVKAPERVGLGLVRTFQQPRVFGALDVRENLVLACHSTVPSRVLADFVGTPRARRRSRERRARADELLATFDLEGHASADAANLPYGIRKRLGLVLGIAAAPTVILLDEPAAGLNEEEVEVLKHDLHRIRTSGVTVWIVEHHMGLVMSISDRVTVLESGRKIAEGPPEVVANDERVLAAYLGGEVA